MPWGLDRVSVNFGRQPALHDVSFAARPGTITVLVGGDGAGKSTSLKVLVGLVRPTSGWPSHPPKEQLGYVPATAGLYTDLTVDENMEFAAAAYRISGRQLDERRSEILRLVGLSSARSRLTEHLSGGMQRKLAVGMALVHSPRLLVLDEPTTGVDPLSRADLWRLITRAAAEGAAVVVATTYVNEAARGNFAVLLEAGRTLAAGAPQEIVEMLPGALGTSDRPPPGDLPSWRRGLSWRLWSPDGTLPAGAWPATADIEDAAIVAALAEGDRS